MVLSPTATRLDVAKTVRDILAAADKAEPKLRRLIEAALINLQRSVPNMEAAVATGNVETVLQALRGLDIPRDTYEALSSHLAATATNAAGAEAAAIGVTWNDMHAAAIAWADANAAKMIRLGVTDAVRRTIRDVVTESVWLGVHPSKTAAQIRDVVPLLPRHAAAVNRLYFSSLESGVNVDHARRVAARKAKKLLRYRAVTIARTESIRAANMGQNIVWQTAIDSGMLPQGTKKVWRATPDDRTCPICSVLDGQTVAVNERFQINQQQTPDGLRPLRRPTVERTPPAHPRCRCTLVLEYL